MISLMRSNITKQTNKHQKYRMKKTISIVVVTGDNVHHIEQIKSSHPSPISQAMANVAYRYRKAGKGSPKILKAY